MDGSDSVEVRIVPFGQIERTVVLPAETTPPDENDTQRSQPEVKILKGSTATERPIVLQANLAPYAIPLFGAASPGR